MPDLRRTAAGVAALLALVGLVACGSAETGPAVVVRVGETQISRATVAHWMSVMSVGRTASLSPMRQRQLRQQALGFLISSAWLTGEAASRGMTPSRGEVQRQLAERQTASFPGGEAEATEFMRASGQSLGDLELQARTEVASMKLRQLVARITVDVTRAQVATYYRRHRQTFVLPERREATYTGRRTEAAAEKARKEAEAGKVLASAAQQRVHEVLYGASGPPDRRDALERGIFASNPDGAVSGPFKDGGTYYVFEVTKVIPSVSLTLLQAEGEIRRRLVGKAEQQARAQLIRTWRAEWRARTDCSPGYVAQKCRQFGGQAAPEDPLVFG
jgi:PPIC-type PPIASE domain/SurA N-terminal domain